ncbi:MAG: exopolyphosphatase [Bacteroidetes bacterium]|nr:MAG: exopolyphosphatase [Bacteroidota bacterium]
MQFAVIDIGSNAVRLLFANANGDIDNIIVDKASLIRVPLRLGKDVFNNSKISKAREKKLIKTMKAFKILIGVMEPYKVRAYATSAMREAKNSNKIIKHINNEIGISIEIISGSKEAEIIREINKMIFTNPQYIQLMVDVGGGSTEISAEKNGKLIKLKSFEIGTIRMLNNNYDTGIWDEITDWLSEFRKEKGRINVVGSGGNINKIKKIFGNSSGITLSTETLKQTIETLEPLSIEDRIKNYNMRKDRADVIVPAAKIFYHIQEVLQSDIIHVPKIGLSDGMVHQLYKEFLQEVENE